MAILEQLPLIISDVSRYGNSWVVTNLFVICGRKKMCTPTWKHDDSKYRDLRVSNPHSPYRTYQDMEPRNYLVSLLMCEEKYATLSPWKVPVGGNIREWSSLPSATTRPSSTFRMTRQSYLRWVCSPCRGRGLTGLLWCRSWTKLMIRSFSFTVASWVEKPTERPINPEPLDWPMKLPNIDQDLRKKGDPTRGWDSMNSSISIHRQMI
jgi:hypothetical protein